MYNKEPFLLVVEGMEKEGEASLAANTFFSHLVGIIA
jgi:hypothetical protein